ncbi:Testis-expressed sequence 10 protein, partial [Clydaea vesicula]
WIMPKKSTRKKKIINQDFAKAKLKVGKQLQKPNQTQIKISSKQIQLKAQLENFDETPEVNLVKELASNLVNVNHYNKQIVKESLIKLTKELNPLYQQQLLMKYISTIFDKTLKLMKESDYEIRKELLNFYTAFFPYFQKNQLRPFQKILFLNLTTAFTSLDESVRLYSTRFLDLFFSYFDFDIKNVNLLKINYLNLIAVEDAGNNPKSKIGTTKSRIQVLSSLLEFLRKTCSNENAGDILWFVNKSTNNVKVIGSENDLDCVEYLCENSNILYDINVNESILSRLKEEKLFITKLLPALIDFWLEAVPDALIKQTLQYNQNIQVLDQVLNILKIILNNFFRIFNQNEYQENYLKLIEYEKFKTTFLDSISKHILVHFPFGKDKTVSKDPRLEKILGGMNINLMEIMTNFIVTEDASFDEKTPFENDFMSVGERFYVIQSEDCAVVMKDWISYLPLVLANLNSADEVFSMDILKYLRKVFLSDFLKIQSDTENLKKFQINFEIYLKNLNISNEGSTNVHRDEILTLIIELTYFLDSHVIWDSFRCNSENDFFLRWLIKLFTKVNANKNLILYFLDIIIERQSDTFKKLKVEDFLSVLITVGVIGESNYSRLSYCNNSLFQKFETFEEKLRCRKKFEEIGIENLELTSSITLNSILNAKEFSGHIDEIESFWEKRKMCYEAVELILKKSGNLIVDFLEELL